MTNYTNTNEDVNKESEIIDQQSIFKEPIPATKGFTVIELTSNGNEIALVEPGTWVWALQKAAPYIAEFGLKKILAALTGTPGVKLHSDSLMEISDIVRGRIDEAFAREYTADNKYVIEQLNLYDNTNDERYLQNAEQRSGLLIPRFESLGDEYLGALWCAMTCRLVALRALEEQTGNTGYRIAARRLIDEYGFNGVMGHGTNRLRISLQKRINNISGCSCHGTRQGSGADGNYYEVCKYKNSAGKNKDMRSQEGGTIKGECQSKVRNLRINARNELAQALEKTINPWKNAMATWESI